MKKTYRIEVDCANCANKMEAAANTVPGIKKAAVNFMALPVKFSGQHGDGHRGLSCQNQI